MMVGARWASISLPADLLGFYLSLEFKSMGAIKKKYPVGTSSADRNVLLMREANKKNGQTRYSNSINYFVQLW